MSGSKQIIVPLFATGDRFMVTSGKHKNRKSFVLYKNPQLYSVQMDDYKTSYKLAFHPSVMKPVVTANI